MATAASEDGPQPGERVYVLDDGLAETDDALTADFRHRLGILPDEEADLSEVFKARIGLLCHETEQIGEIPEVEVKWEEEREETLRTFKLSKFAKNNFNNGHTTHFSSEPLKCPLLGKQKEIDKLASVAVWLAIQRFMGDAPSPPPPDVKDRMPVMTRLFRTIEHHSRRKQSSSSNGTKTSSDKEYEPFKVRKRSSWKKIFSRSGSKNEKHNLGRSNSTTSTGSIESTGSNDADAVITETVNLSDNIPVGDVDLIHFIAGHGILRKELRDEIYCQLCKQVTKHPTEENCRRGWMLHCLIAGCFLPSEQFIKYYRCFLKDTLDEHKDYATYTNHMLRRTTANGLRYHPPNWLEFQATVMRKYVMLPIVLPDGKVQSVETDSATTASEVVQKLAASVNLTDTFGFSLYICIYDKVSSLGSGMDHIMDAISECEQLTRARGNKEEDAPWRLFFRKELFTPWHDPELDPVATDLIYAQLCRGVRTEEHKLRSEEDLASFISKRWYIEQGTRIIPGKLQSTLHEYISENLLVGGRSREAWTQAVIAAFDTNGFADEKVPRQQVKWHTVATAPRKWPFQFSGLFEAFKLSGPWLPKNEVIIGVSSRGLFITDDTHQVALTLRFYEMVEVFASRTGKSRGQSFSLLTVKGDEYTFVSPNSDTICKLVNTFLDGLRRRSKWAVGLQEFILQDYVKTQTTFGFVQGDVIELLDETTVDEKLQKEDWLYGKVERSGVKGQLPLECVYVLPTCDRPPDDFLGMFKAMTSSDTSTLPRKKGAVVISMGTIGRHSDHGVDTSA